MWNKIAHLGYRLALQLFPRAFRHAWGAEMQATFSDSLEAASRQGIPFAARLLLREALDLPGAALRLHLEEIRAPGHPVPVSTADWAYPARTSELFIAAGVIGLPAAGILLNLPLTVTLSCLALLLAGVLFLGVHRSLGRWALPVFGVVLSAFNFGLVYHWMAGLLTPAVLARFGWGAQDDGARLLLHAFGTGLLWCCLFAFCALAYWLLSRMQRFATFLSGVRQDWTLVSYLLYCGALFSFLLANGQNLNVGQALVAPVPVLVVSTSLVTGAWLFLRSPRQWQRMSALVIGLTLATMGMFGGELDPGPPGGIQFWLSLPALNTAQWHILQRSLLDWAWLIVFIFAPALLRWAPPERRSAFSSS